jgi:hypothetical protein
MNSRFLCKVSAMKKFLLPRKITVLLVVALLAVLSAPTAALAYIDPGTGSFVVQGIIAAVVGAGFAIKVFWRRIVSALTGKSPAEDDDDE